MNTSATAVLRSLARPGRMFMSVNAQGFGFQRFGAPASVLSAQTEKVSEDLKANQVLVKMLAAPITPTDLAQVQGFLGGNAPAFGGNEGVGVVVGVGSGVQGLKANDYVVPAKLGLGTWRTHLAVDASAVAKVDGLKDLPVEQAATCIVSPVTAQLLLSNFVNLQAGDVIVQNNAASTVGQAVIQAAAARGIKTVNIMRRRDDWDNVVNHFQGLGATIVVPEDFARTPAFAKLLADLPAAKLGLNSVGGEAAASVASALGQGATLVTFGSVSHQPVPLSTKHLIDSDITVRGFSLARWLAATPADKRNQLLKDAVTATRNKKMDLLLAREPFADFAHALKRAQTPGGRRVVLVM